MRGPKSFHNAGSATLFEVARSFIVAEGLKNNHEIFLNQDQWKIQRTSTRSKLWKSTLGDLSCQLPSIAADLEEWRITGGEAKSLIAKVVYVLNEAFEWRWRWEIAHGGCAKEVTTNPRSNLFFLDNGTPIFTKVLRFENNFLASAVTSYDALLIYLLTTAEELLGDAWQQLVEVEIPSELSNNYMYLGSPLLLPSDVRSVSQVFEELFRTLEGQLDHENAVPGDAFRLLLPLFVAGRGVQADCVEARYLQMATTEMAKITGFTAFDRKWKEDGRYFKQRTSSLRASWREAISYI